MAFKKGDVVRIIVHDQWGYPESLWPQKAVITKRVHPACFKLAMVRNELDPREDWKLTSERTRGYHPSDLMPDGPDSVARLNELRQQWRDQSDADTIAASAREIADRERRHLELNRAVRPLLARMLGGK